MTESAKQQEAEAIYNRQVKCKHSFIRGAADSAPRCVHCGISRHDHEQLMIAMTVSAVPRGTHANP